MNTHPILFSTPMVEAILSGQKTQTRREVKPQNFSISDQIAEVTDNGLMVHFSKEGNGTSFMGTKNKFGSVGDILWVRETFCLTQPNDPETYYFGYKCGADSHSYYPASEKYNYSTPDEWKPSIHMPKEACRIFLEITAIRVEKLKDIGYEDAKAEGVEYLGDGTFWYKNYLNDPLPGTSNALFSFQTLWMSINGKDSWIKNPWVWVIEFKRIEKPENFLS